MILGEESGLEDTVASALRQIDEKNYDTQLLDRGIPEKNIKHYGFAFCGKKSVDRMLREIMIRAIEKYDYLAGGIIYVQFHIQHSNKDSFRKGHNFKFIRA